MGKLSPWFSKILKDWGEKESTDGFSVWFDDTSLLEPDLFGEKQFANGFNVDSIGLTTEKCSKLRL